jgi:hypothetical protein
MNLNKTNILIHIIVISLVLVVEKLQEPDLFVFSLNFLGFLFILYLNYFFIGKWLLKKPSIGTLFLWCVVNLFIAFILIISAVYFLDDSELPPIKELLVYCFEESVYGFRHLAPICLAGFVYKHWFLNRDKNKALETVKTSHQIQVLKNGFSIVLVNKMLIEMELKAQLNPKSIEHEVLMLSNLLRYKLYESSAPKVSLNKELEIANDQINLHNSLFNTNFKLVNQLDSDLEIKTGKLLNTVDELLKNHPEENLELVIKADNNRCLLTALMKPEIFTKTLN